MKAHCLSLIEPYQTVGQLHPSGKSSGILVPEFMAIDAAGPINKDIGAINNFA